MSDLIKLSVSKTSTFKSCKAKYKFSYILKLPKKEFEYHLFGRFVHRVLELFHLHYLNKSSESYTKVMSSSFNEALQEVKSKLSLKQKDEAIEILKIYLKNLKPSDIKNILSVEKVFNHQINDGLILTGMIDRIQLDEDGLYHIIDYKTSKSKTYLKDDLLQLLTYAYIIYNEYPDVQKVRVSYIMLRHKCELITKEFELEDILSVKNIYEKYAEEIHNEKEFLPNPTKLCHYCDFSSSCEAGKEILAQQFTCGIVKW